MEFYGSTSNLNSGPCRPSRGWTIEGDERVGVNGAIARLEASLVKSDQLLDNDSSTRSKRVRDKTMVKEAWPVTTRADF